jgi:hypothetical protein
VWQRERAAQRVELERRRRRLVRRKAAGIVNLIIDIAELRGMPKGLGIMLHAFNELVLLRDPRTFMLNLARYEIAPRLKRRGAGRGG